jgi:predicted permease
MQGHDYTLVGVAQPGFTGHAPGTPADLWIPLSMEKEISPGWNGLDDKFFQSLYLIARLEPGVTREQAQSASNLLFQQILRSDYLTVAPSPKDLADVGHAGIELTPAAGGIPRLSLKFSEPLEILMVIVGLVPLIACANIANMLLARGVARTREVAVRQALGATRGRIVVQLLTESLLLAFTGSALGVLLAWRASRLLLVIASGSAVPIPLDLTPDLRVLGFALAVTCLTALLFGVAPALRTTRLQLVPALKDGRTSSSASTRSRLARGLIVGQIALSILLVTVSGLFLHSLVNLTRVDLGFDPRNVLVFTLDEYSANLPLDLRLIQLQQQIEERVQTIPGVKSESLSMFTFNQGEWSDDVLVQDVPRTPENGHNVLYNVIGTQYFSTFGIPLMAGRNFTAQDTAKSPQVAIVNETFARRFFGNGSPIGHRLQLGDDPAQPYDIEIVGVARDAHYVGIGEEPQMAAYFPWSQRVQYFGNFSVRYSGSASEIIPAVRRAVAAVNPNIAVAQVETLGDQVRASIVTPRLIGFLSAFFGALAVFLAAIGIYGLMNLSIARRNSEIGIRLALGARAGAVLWMVLRESLVLLAIGLAIGLPVALAGSRVLRQELFHLSPADPITYVTAALIISTVTVLAAWLPARRAARVDPMVALRCD